MSCAHSAADRAFAHSINAFRCACSFVRVGVADGVTAVVVELVGIVVCVTGVVDVAEEAGWMTTVGVVLIVVVVCVTGAVEVVGGGSVIGAAVGICAHSVVERTRMFLAHSEFHAEAISGDG